MITSYMLILTLSAGLIAYCSLRIALRLSRMLSLSGALPAGVAALLSAVLFLVVVAAPAPMLVGVILVGLCQLVERRYPLPQLAVWGIPLLAAFMAIDPAHLPAFSHIPPLFVQAALVALLFAITQSARFVPTAFTSSSIGLVACLLPLIAAPLLSTAPSSIALDAALIAASILGATLAATRASTMGIARAPFALLLGWLMLQPAAHGAWAFSLASLLVYGGFIAYALTQQPFDDRYGA